MSAARHRGAPASGLQSEKQNNMPRNTTASPQGFLFEIRSSIAKLSIRLSSRLIFFARWLAPELWDGPNA